MRIIVSQVVLALALIIVGAQVFVGAVEHLSTVDRAGPDDPGPDHRADRHRAAGEVQQRPLGADGKDTLAMGNITGAMVFQSCLPTVLGLLFTTWLFTPETRHLLRCRPASPSYHDPDLRA